MKVLEPFKGKVPDEVFTAEYNPPKTDGSGDARANLEIASKILDEDGWKVENGVRTKNGMTLDFEILLDSETFERITQPFIQNLAQIGVKARMRTVDPAQYQKRMDQFDFDMTVNLVGQSRSPGNEQRDQWGSKSADTQGGQNLGGIKDPVIDALVDKIIAAKDRNDLIYSTRALDRVLQWGYYFIPHWNLPEDRLVYWNKFSHPSTMPEYGLTLDTWWVDPQKEAALKQKVSAEPATPTPAQPAAPATDQQAAAPASAPAPAPSAAPAPAATPPADRGSTPIPYIIGGIVLAVLAFAIGRRGRKS
jgi:microcin C transport system substrate-binding protein